MKFEKKQKLCLTKEKNDQKKKSIIYVFLEPIAWYWITMAINIAAVVLTFITNDAYPIMLMRLLFGTIFVLFLPGFAFTKMFYPKQVPFSTRSKNLELIERLALSIILSIAIVTAIGLVLNFTTWGLNSTSITASLFISTLIFSSIAALREHYEKVNIVGLNSC